MPTHEIPPESAVPVALGLTEGDEFWLTLESGDTLLCTVTETNVDTPGSYFGVGGVDLEFESAGVSFEFTIPYRESPDGTVEAESLDFRLTEGFEWSIPMNVGIESIRPRSG